MGRKRHATSIFRRQCCSPTLLVLVCFLVIFEISHVINSTCDADPHRHVQTVNNPTTAAPTTAPPTSRPTRRVSEPTQFSADRREVAFCLHSIRFHTLALTGANFSRFLVEPLDADVFAAGQSEPEAAQAVLRVFGDHRVVSMHFQKQLAYPSMQALIRALPNYPLYANWSHNNNAFSPGPLMQAFWVNMCENLISAHEAKRGRPYKWKVYSRADYLWLAPHPPVHLMQQPKTIWMTDTGRYGGMQPLTATCRADACDVYSRLWESLTSDHFYTVMRKFQLDEARYVDAETCNTEKINHSWIVANGYEGWGYRSVGHIRCGGQRLCIASDRRFCHFAAPCREVVNQVWKYRRHGAQAESNAPTILARGWNASLDFVKFPYFPQFRNGMCLPKVGCTTTKKGEHVCVT